MSTNQVGAVCSTVPGVTAPHPDTEAPGNLLAPEPTVRSG